MASLRVKVILLPGTHLVDPHGAQAQGVFSSNEVGLQAQLCGMDWISLGSPSNCDEHFGASTIDNSDGCGKTNSGSGTPNSTYLNQMHAARNAAGRSAPDQRIRRKKRRHFCDAMGRELMPTQLPDLMPTPDVF